MVKWEFAALVLDESIWHLVKPADVEPAEMAFNKGGNENDRRTRSSLKWPAPTSWRKGNDGYDAILAHPLLNAESIDGGSEPDILFSSHDLLTLINLAGAEGWEITGGIGLADGHRETRYRMMRREL